MGPLVLAVIAFATCKLVGIATIPAFVLSGLVLVSALIVRDATRWTVAVLFMIGLCWFVSPWVMGPGFVDAWRARLHGYAGPAIVTLLFEPAGKLKS